MCLAVIDLHSYMCGVQVAKVLALSKAEKAAGCGVLGIHAAPFLAHRDWPAPYDVSVPNVHHMMMAPQVKVCHAAVLRRMALPLVRMVCQKHGLQAAGVHPQRAHEQRQAHCLHGRAQACTLQAAVPAQHT